MMKDALQPTDYASLSLHVDALVESAPGDYSACLTALMRAMREEFPALARERNPIVAGLGSWTRAQLGFIIEEYSAFSNAAIHMFLEARIRNHWSALRDEIVRNMDEEMGTLTSGIPHLELMRHGYRVELGLETDGLQYAGVTEDFIRRMSLLFHTRDNTRLAGVLLAFEGTAVSEFRIVEAMLRRYKEMTGGVIPPESLTGCYVAGHVAPEASITDHDPEMDHYRGMAEAVGAGVAGHELQPLVRGFLSVCLELNRWWELLALEALQRRIRDRLAHQGAPPDPYRALRVRLTAPGRAVHGTDPDAAWIERGLA